MTNVRVNFKRLNPEAKIPSYANPGDAGLDLTAVRQHYDVNQDFIEYGTGLAMEIPDGHVGLIFPRSSISKYGLSMANAVGVIDSKYRGEVTIRFRLKTGRPIYNVGDRVAQLIILPYPTVEIEEVDALSDTVRGVGGYGSSGI